MILMDEQLAGFGRRHHRFYQSIALMLFLIVEGAVCENFIARDSPKLIAL